MAGIGNRYLLEIGTEELPGGFLTGAPAELADKAKSALDDAGIAYSDMKVYATPRRLALVIDGLPDRQPDRNETLKGPPTRIALDDAGKPTKAAEGFAKKNNATAADLEKEELDGEEYVVLKRDIKGQPVKHLLPDLLPDLVLNLSGSHFMRWGNHETRFSRPIRWLLSLWNDGHLPVRIGDLDSGTVTFGHRILADNPVSLKSAGSYLETLEKDGFVIADQHRRREAIWDEVQKTAGELKGRVSDNPGLLDTVTMLVEYPSVVVGGFEERFLEIPDDVTKTVMMAHQKYFPVETADGKSLQPRFITISNGRRDKADIIRHGNEKVIRARLEDARFFFEEDQKAPLESYVDKLAGVTFQKDLGTMLQKAGRIRDLAGHIAAALGYPEKEVSQARRAAYLAKADLVTGMVFEFTELQGIMGSRYAALNGEEATVAGAIFEHYLPRFTGDRVPESHVGIAAGLADKLDTLVAVFSQKKAKLPTGSRDPLALRRMASGVLQTVLENNLNLNVAELLEWSFSKLDSVTDPEKTHDMETTLSLLTDFILQRLKVSLLEQNIRHDIIDAVLAASNPLADLPDAMSRIEHLKALVQDEDRLKKIYEPANRTARILGDNYYAGVTPAEVAPAHFEHESEKALLEAVKTLDGRDAWHEDYPELIKQLEALSARVDAFFDHVMVNADNDAVRQNRYNLLSLLNRQYLRIAAFARLAV